MTDHFIPSKPRDICTFCFNGFVDEQTRICSNCEKVNPKPTVILSVSLNRFKKGNYITVDGKGLYKIIKVKEANIWLGKVPILLKIWFYIKNIFKKLYNYVGGVC